jgi:hypothetical protein
MTIKLCVLAWGRYCKQYGFVVTTASNVSNLHMPGGRRRTDGRQRNAPLQPPSHNTMLLSAFPEMDAAARAILDRSNSGRPHSLHILDGLFEFIEVSVQLA